jgi:hypothetical protein
VAQPPPGDGTMQFLLHRLDFIRSPIGGFRPWSARLGRMCRSGSPRGSVCGACVGSVRELGWEAEIARVHGVVVLDAGNGQGWEWMGREGMGEDGMDAFREEFPDDPCRVWSVCEQRKSTELDPSRVGTMHDCPSST